MLLPAGRQFDRPVAQQISANQKPFLGDRDIIDLRATTPDQAPSLRVAGSQAGNREQPERRNTGLKLRRRHRHARQIGRGLAFFKCSASGFSGEHSLFRTVGQGRRFGRQDLLRLIDVRAVQCFEPADLRQRQVGEQPQKSADVTILGVAPELPILVRGQAIQRQPNRAACCLGLSWFNYYCRY